MSTSTLSSNEMRIVFRGDNASVNLRVDATSKDHGEESVAMTVTVSGVTDMSAAKLFKAAVTRAEELLRRTHRE